VTAAEQAVVQTTEQATAMTLVAAVLLAATTARVARRGTTARSFSRTSTGRLASRFGTAAGLATLVAAARRLTRVATAVAAAVVQAKHAIQELETEALAAQAYADYKRTKDHVPFHRATSPLLELRIAWHPDSRAMTRLSFARFGRAPESQPT
jgi:hypothetical protein